MEYGLFSKVFGDKIFEVFFISCACSYLGLLTYTGTQ